jgi:hypothetical protein
MKKKLLYLFIAISSISFSQTLEKSYISEGFSRKPKNLAFLTESNLHYLTMSLTNNEISIFNSDHSLYKTISLTIPTGFKLTNIHFATDKLFNSDSKIEILVRTEIETGCCEKKMLLFNEDGGNNIFDFGDKYDVDIFRDKNNNYKILTSSEDSNNKVSFDIYSLSGTLTVSQQNFLSRQKIIGFPNPSSNLINITNPLKNNENEKIQVFDINGRKVLEKKIIGNGENIELDISELSKGVYNYKIREFGNKFVKE